MQTMPSLFDNLYCLSELMPEYFACCFGCLVINLPIFGNKTDLSAIPVHEFKNVSPVLKFFFKDNHLRCLHANGDSKSFFLT